MKLHADHPASFSITAYGPGWISLGGEKITQSTVLGSHGERMDWACQLFSDLGQDHFNQLAGFKPELILFGSGQQLRRPRPEWLALLASSRIGVEAMDTAAACRTYNILAGEGRHVLAALLLEKA